MRRSFKEKGKRLLNKISGDATATTSGASEAASSGDESKYFLAKTAHKKRQIWPPVMKDKHLLVLL